MMQTYVSKRFRTFRKPITRRLANGGLIKNPGVYLVGEQGPEIKTFTIIAPVLSAKQIAKLVSDFMKKNGDAA